MIFIHGIPAWFDARKPQDETPSNKAWIRWLSSQLLFHNIHPIVPDMPNMYFPNYRAWEKELDRYKPDENTILVGHSCGAGFLLHYLSKHRITVKKLIFVAPWRGETVPMVRDLCDDEFWDYVIDRDLINRCTEGITLFCTTADVFIISAAVKEIMRRLPDTKRIILDRTHGHFGDSIKVFPEMLDEILEAVEE